MLIHHFKAVGLLRREVPLPSPTVSGAAGRSNTTPDAVVADVVHLWVYSQGVPDVGSPADAGLNPGPGERYYTTKETTPAGTGLNPKCGPFTGSRAGYLRRGGVRTNVNGQQLVPVPSIPVQRGSSTHRQSQIWLHPDIPGHPRRHGVRP